MTKRSTIVADPPWPCLFCVRGKLRLNSMEGLPTAYLWPRLPHSVKPDAFYDLVEKASPGPYLEMFARRARMGGLALLGRSIARHCGGGCVMLRVTMTKDEQIARLEQLGSIVKDCPGCERFYEAENPIDVFAPRHKTSPMCQSGSRPHCTCDRCF